MARQNRLRGSGKQPLVLHRSIGERVPYPSLIEPATRDVEEAAHHGRIKLSAMGFDERVLQSDMLRFPSMAPWSSPLFSRHPKVSVKAWEVHTWLCNGCPPFVLGWGVIAEGGVPSLPIVEHPEVFEDILRGFVSYGTGLMVYKLMSERSAETFDEGVVLAVVFVAHAGNEIVRGELGTGSLSRHTDCRVRMVLELGRGSSVRQAPRGPARLTQPLIADLWSSRPPGVDTDQVEPPDRAILPGPRCG